MTTELASEMMTTEEAHAVAEEIRRLTESFKRNLARLRTLVLEFDERKGWAALGHNTIEECARERFGWSPSQFWRQLTAGKIDRAAGLDVGTTPTRGVRRPATISQGNIAPCNVSLPEGCATANNPPEASANGAPTAEKVRQAVERIEQQSLFRCDSCEREFTAHQLVEDGCRLLCRECNEQRILAENQPLPGETPAVTPASGGGVTFTGSVPPPNCTGDTPAVTQSEPEPKRPTPTIDALLSPDEEWTVGLIDRVVFTRAGLTLADLVDAGRRILAAAEQGGATWEMRLKAACRPGLK